MRKIFITFIIFIGTMSNIFAQNTDYLFMIEHAVKAPSGHNTHLSRLHKIAAGRRSQQPGIVCQSWLCCRKPLYRGEL